PHEVGVPLLHVGLVWDSRDSELVTTRGAFHELSVRGAPAMFGDASHHYFGINLTTRFFAPLYRDRAVLAVRVVGDTLFGDPPLYELSNIEEQSTLGGEFGVRGVPVQRYSGETKFFANAELRTRLASFRALDQD